MPKKITTNTKSLEARERKAAVKKAKNEEDERRKEDAKWVDDDKNLAKKQEKKAEEERKKAELLRKKAEAKALLEQEEKSIKVAAKIPQSKMTRAQIDLEVEKRNKNIESLVHKNDKPVVPKVAPIEENLNRVMFDVHVASTVDEAIKVLKVGDSEEDKHPEKRMKAAFKAYEEAQMPIIKAENPTLKLSQLKQIIFKNWQKAPENPLFKQ
ncbi:coiled-coil domain-containing protein 124-B [Chironomus tepperi]|uniref:coiled-coil domain-containing protein 124-B n=1 Tax=Chironomus tepperi TaxID=113505 RepID=UPI00391FAC71